MSLGGRAWVLMWGTGSTLLYGTCKWFEVDPVVTVGNTVIKKPLARTSPLQEDRSACPVYGVVTLERPRGRETGSSDLPHNIPHTWLQDSAGQAKTPFRTAREGLRTPARSNLLTLQHNIVTYTVHTQELQIELQKKKNPSSPKGSMFLVSLRFRGLYS